MFDQWEQMAKQVKTLTVIKGKLELDKTNLEAKVINLELQLTEKDKEIEKLLAELLKENKSLMKIPSGTAALNHMLSIQKPYGDKSSIGYKLLYKHEKESTSTESVLNTNAKKDNIQANGPQHKSKFVKESERIIEKSANSEGFIPVCHFCNRKRHIRPKCYKLQTYLQAMISRPKSFNRPIDVAQKVYLTVIVVFQAYLSYP